MLNAMGCKPTPLITAKSPELVDGFIDRPVSSGENEP